LGKMQWECCEVLVQTLVVGAYLTPSTRHLLELHTPIQIPLPPPFHSTASQNPLKLPVWQSGAPPLLLDHPAQMITSLENIVVQYTRMQNSWKPIILIMRSQHSVSPTTIPAKTECLGYMYIKRSQLCNRKTHRTKSLQNCAASSSGLLCCVCPEASTQGVLRKSLQATLFVDVHCRVAQNKTRHCSCPSLSGAFATDCSRGT